MRRVWTLAGLVAAVLVATVTADIPKECPKNDYIGPAVHLAHEWDCEKFYKCDHGNRVLFVCPFLSGSKRLHFNPVLQVCDWPDNAGCISGTRPTTSAGGETRPTVSTPKPTQRPITNSTKPSVKPTKPAKPTTPSGKPTKPTKPITNSTPPSVNPTRPTKPITDSTTPSVNSTEPTNPITDATTPSVNSTEPTSPITNSTTPSIDATKPTDPITDSTTPSVSSTEPTDPITNSTTPSVDPTKPTDPITDSTTPSVNSTEPTDSITNSTTPSVDPTQPTDPITDSTTPSVNSTEPTDPITNSTTPSVDPTQPTDPITDSTTPSVNSTEPTSPITNSTTPSVISTESTNLTATTIASVITTVDTPVPTDSLETVSTLNPSGDYVPHEFNCSLFYEVINSEKILRECPPGLLFSRNNRTCLPPSEVRCTTMTPLPMTTSATVPTTIAINCGDIGDGMLIPHECICSRYYACSKGNLIRKDCPEGLHFDKTRYICVTPESAGCESTTTSQVTVGTTAIIPTECPPDNSGPLVQLPHLTNCSLYYLCDNGNKKLQQCPQDLHFNPILRGCDWADSAGCIVGSTTATITETVTSPVPTKPSIPATVTEPVTELPTECPLDDPTPNVKLPHPNNCSLYYACLTGGNKVVMECPDGLHFNATSQDCDWPESAACRVSTSVTPASTSSTQTLPISITQDPIDSTTQDATENSSEPTISTTKDQSQPTDSTVGDPSELTDLTTEQPSNPTDSTTKNSSDPTELPTECPRDDPKPNVRLPHPTNCSLFYSCLPGGRKVVMICPDHLHFNARTQDCDWPNSASCDVSTSVTPASTASPPTSPISTTQDTDSTTDRSTASSEPTTVSSCVDGSKSAHQSNCSLYYECENGINAIKQCTEGLQFNPVLNICDWWEFAGCTAENGNPPGSTTTDSADSSDTTIDELSSTVDSSQPIDSTVDESSPTSEPITDLPCVDGSRSAHRTNCSLYYECVDGRNAIKICTEGLQFNPVIGICDWWEFAGCTAETVQSSDSATTVSPDTSEITTDDDSEQNTAAVTTILPTEFLGCVGSCPDEDPTTNSVLLPNRDCTKFCECSNGQAYVFHCPGQLHFSPTNLVCDYPRRAKCVGQGGSGQAR